MVLFHAQFLSDVYFVAFDTIELAKFFHRSSVACGDFAERFALAYGGCFRGLLFLLLGFAFAAVRLRLGGLLAAARMGGRGG